MQLEHQKCSVAGLKKAGISPFAVLIVATDERSEHFFDEDEAEKKRGERDPEEIFEKIFSMEKYRKQLSRIGLEKKRSIEVSMLDISLHSSSLSDLILEHPDEYLKYAEIAALNRLRIEDPEYAVEVAKSPEGLKVRLKDLPMLTPMRHLNSMMIGKMVAVRGIVVRASILKPLLFKAVFECERCGELTPPIKQEGFKLRKPYMCMNPECKGKRFKLREDESVFIDSQDLKIQEMQEEMPPGQMPRQMMVRVITSDIIGVARPGDRVTVNGIVKAEPVWRNSRTYIMYLEANNIEVRHTEEDLKLDEEEERKIRRIAKDPNIIEKIVQSIAPSIYGHEEIKKAIMCLLFGGVTKDYRDIKVRGDPNVLLVGDPGTAKSQMLLAAVRLAPRGIYTSGRGTSTAGLTAAVIFEEKGNVNLEAGALVLADKGIAAIDELEKMRPEDRSSIHEALEQRTVSIAKGGIVATLNARCAVLAAANPTFGRYDDYRPVIENIRLPPTLLSRFDLIFILKDKPSEDTDFSVAEHILSLHQKEKKQRPPIKRDLLRKYIAYARTQCHPKITNEAKEKLLDFYLKMRRYSSEEGSPMAITPRQLESLIRLSEAFARAALKEEVMGKEAEMAIELMKSSIQQVGIDLETGKIDIDLMIIGKPTSLREKMATILDIVREIEKEKTFVSLEDIAEQAKDRGLDGKEIERILLLLKRDNQLIEPRQGYYKTVRP